MDYLCLLYFIKIMELNILDPFFLSLLFLFFGFFLIFFFQLFIFKKEKSKPYLFLSEEFEKYLREFIKKETKKEISQFKNILYRLSEEIIKNYQIEAEKEKKEFVDNLLKKEGEFKKEFENSLSQFKKEFSHFLKFFQIISEEISRRAEEKTFEVAKEVKEEMKKFQKENLNLLEKSKKDFDKEFKALLEKTEKILVQKIEETEKEIENYKKEKLKEIDEEIFALLFKIAKDVLGVTIDLSTHEKLVMEALEKAKKEIF